MKKKKPRKQRNRKQIPVQRILYPPFLVLTTVLVSFYGGTVPYLLFYFTVMIPVLALAYSLYVYSRFRIVQEVSRTVVKAQKVPYRLLLANEDFIPFVNLTLHYYTDRVTIGEEDGEAGERRTEGLCLAGHQKLSVDAKVYCKYRGTYPVGVKSVSVTDFLGLFTITYPMRDQIRLTARPRILPLERLAVSLEQKDPKSNISAAAKLQEQPDAELRSYQRGDSLKRIHWKNSARAGELLVRRQMPDELYETVLMMDLVRTQETGEARYRTEDNIVEAALAFVHHYYEKNIPVKIVYMQGWETKEILVDAGTGFEGFYDLCADLSFNAEKGLDEVWKEYAGRAGSHAAFIVITERMNESLKNRVEEYRRIGGEVVWIEAGGLVL